MIQTEIDSFYFIFLPIRNVNSGFLKQFDSLFLFLKICTSIYHIKSQNPFYEVTALRLFGQKRTDIIQRLKIFYLMHLFKEHILINPIYDLK